MFFALPAGGAPDADLDTLSGSIAAESEGRPVFASNRHATLAFVGQVPHAAVARLIEIGDALPRARFELALDTVGSFKGARVAWIGPSRVVPELDALHDALCARLRGGAFRVEERPFHAHVTLARHCRRTLPQRRVAPIAWPVREVVLYESIGTPGGPRYEPRAAWPLDAT